MAEFLLGVLLGGGGIVAFCAAIGEIRITVKIPYDDDDTPDPDCAPA
jgi:hypothetical protein